MKKIIKTFVDSFTGWSFIFSVWLSIYRLTGYVDIPWKAIWIPSIIMWLIAVVYYACCQLMNGDK